jgi:hypothetical protein
MSKINFRLDAFYLRIEVKFMRVITNKETEYPVSFTLRLFGYARLGIITILMCLVRCKPHILFHGTSKTCVPITGVVKATLSVFVFVVIVVVVI